MRGWKGKVRPMVNSYTMPERKDGYHYFVPSRCRESTSRIEGAVRVKTPVLYACASAMPPSVIEQKERPVFAAQLCPVMNPNVYVLVEQASQAPPSKNSTAPCTLPPLRRRACTFRSNS